MASRDLTNAYFDRRTAALKRRTALGSPNGNGLVDHGRGNNKTKCDRLTAGGSRDDDDGHSLMLIEVSLLLRCELINHK